MNRTPKSKPPAATRWSCRETAEATGISTSTVQRVWSTFRLKPHRQRSFGLSTHPFLIEKLREVVGLNPDPPKDAVVLCVDEKCQCQALEPSQQRLPMSLGHVEGVRHDYVRHGTTTLFAALDIVQGNVLTKCTPRHRHQEFLAFLRTIDSNVPTDSDVYVVMDN